MYKDIYDLPVRIYHRIIETSSYELLFIGKHAKKIYKINPSSAYKLWDRINSQLIDKFGVSEEFKMIFYKQQDINNLEIKVITGDLSAIFFINEYKEEIERIKKRMITVKDYRKHHAKLYRILNERYQRDPHNLSTFEFYNDLNDLQNEMQEKETSKEMSKIINA